MNAEEKDQPGDGYEDLFLRFARGVEKVLIIALFVLFAALFAAQALLQSDDFRRMLVKVERMEGNPYLAARDGK